MGKIKLYLEKYLSIIKYSNCHSFISVCYFLIFISNLYIIVIYYIKIYVCTYISFDF